MNEKSKSMKNVWLILFIITFTCCNSRHKTTDNNKTSNVDKVLNEDKTLSSDDIMLDSTNIYVFKNSQEKVTGILKTQIQEFFHDDEIIRETIIRNGVAYNVIDYSKDHVLIGECDLKHGKLEGEYRMYYPSRKIKAKFYLKDDKLNGLFQSYDKYNGLKTEMNYKDGVLDGVAKYYSNGKQTKEILYENGKEVKSYKFDKNGNKIISIDDYLAKKNIKVDFKDALVLNKKYSSNKLGAIFKEDIFYDTKWQSATPLQQKRFSESNEGKSRLQRLQNEKAKLFSSICCVEVSLGECTRYNLDRKCLDVYFDNWLYWEHIGGVKYQFLLKKGVDYARGKYDQRVLTIPCDEDSALKIEKRVLNCKLSILFVITPESIIGYEPGVFVGQNSPVIQTAILKMAIIDKVSGEKYLEY